MTLFTLSSIFFTCQTMSATRFLLFTATFPLRTHSHKPLSLMPPRVLTQPFHFSSLRFRRYSSSFAVDTVTGGDTDTANFPPHHPWPEWVAFIDRLKAKGYFEGENSSNDTGFSNSESVGVYTDMNFVKDTCFSFARDRYDVFKSLSIEHVQKVVEHGCPNLLRKAVNSAKRLRAYARLDEGDVCSACNLRGSCDRAYVILKESEVAARTVDILRILMFYALDPLVISGGEKPAGRELIDVSAKKLFSELIELSETAPDPSLPKPTLKPVEKKQMKFFEDEPSQNIEMGRGNGMVKFVDEQSQNVEMKRGDWMCPKCNFMNFSRNIQCLKCKEDGPKNVGGVNVEMKKGDWICTECSFMNFSRNIRCLKCKAEGPKRVAVDEVEMKPGDWNCPKCSFMNFASNKKCLRCREPRPQRQLNPGEWECPSCDFVNYRRNKVCLKCNLERPKKLATAEYEDQIWRSSH